MPKILWEGNQAWGKAFPGGQPPAGGCRIKRPEDILKGALPYALPPMALCFLCVFLKTSAAGGFLFDLRFMPLGFAAGFLLIPVHELLHAVCYPTGATVYTGVCLKKVAAYAVSFFPLSRGRYILMSLLPTLLGLIPLALFLLCPLQWKGLLTACVPPAFMGLISPCPDYMDVALILKQAPAGAKIQVANDGLYYIV